MKISYMNEIQLLEEEIGKNSIPSDTVLIKQTFVVWYLLVEGNNVVDKKKLQSMLDRNIIIINKYYSGNPYLLFLKGWMLQISPWFVFDVKDDDGSKYLKLAYKYHNSNLLFKWALRGNIDLPKEELNAIKYSIENEFGEYYIDYQPIREYFQDVVKTS